MMNELFEVLLAPKTWMNESMHNSVSPVFVIVYFYIFEISLCFLQKFDIFLIILIFCFNKYNSEHDKILCVDEDYCTVNYYNDIMEEDVGS